ncbi:MAG: helix-turn-helix domain-containing protein [Marinicella sp.]
MNQVDRQFVTDQEPSTILSFSLVKLLNRFKQTEPLKLIWWCLALCVLSSTLSRYMTNTSGFTHHLLVALGSGGCAWFWLLSRSLFRDSQALKSKAVFLVPAVIVVEAFEALMPTVGMNGTSNEFNRVFSNVASLICIAAIVYVWNETLSGFGKIRSKQERRFRIIFLSVFSIPVAIAVLWVMGAEPDTIAAEWNNGLMTFCAFIGVAGSRLAVEYRLRSSRTKSTLAAHATDDLSSIEDSKLLADQVLNAINHDSLLTQANLKVADLAEHIGVQEYKVTRCITNHLQYRNFNHMMNKHRIDRAVGILTDPNNNHLKIATIAFDCGFNSLGPFNRSFKQHIGMTPRNYRQELALK